MFTFMAFFIILILLSIRERIYVIKKKQELLDLPVEPRETPVSDAIVDLIASAGGVYVALLMFFSFLKIELPETIKIIAVEVDPLAFTGLVIALIQPFFLSFKIMLERRRI